jgi:hypothetical protein
MEHTGSSPCSQHPDNGRYSERDKSSPHSPTVSIIILSAHLRPGVPRDLFFPCFQPKCYAHFWSAPFVLHAPPISSSLYKKFSSSDLHALPCSGLIYDSVAHSVVYRRAGRPGFDSRQGQEIFLFATVSRPALGPTQPPIQSVPGSSVV